jgi:hypothetical protein
MSLLRLLIIIAGLCTIGLETMLIRSSRPFRRPSVIFMGVFSVASSLFVVFLFFNHVCFPLHLNITDGGFLQQFERAASFTTMYPAPAPDFIPWAYNPLYVLISVPFSWFLGVNLFTLRIVAVIGTIGCGLLLFMIVKHRTGSKWWALIAVGLFSNAYYAMEGQFDSARPESMLMLLVLLGCYTIDNWPSRIGGLLGVAILCCAFWVKQHGAVFTVGAVLLLTFRDGLRRSIPYWIVALVLGPICYTVLGQFLFGSHFHFYTWKVPTQWSEMTTENVIRYGRFMVKFYPLLSASALGMVIWRLKNKRLTTDIWTFQFIFAACTGLLGILDTYSSDNIFIPVGTWSILVGVLGFATLLRGLELDRYFSLRLAGIAVSFSLLVYNPFNVIVPKQSTQSYADLLRLLKNLNGQVFAPSQGYIKDFRFYPAVHWGALEDLIRGPGRDTRNHPITRGLLHAVIAPDRESFILINHPLRGYPWLAFLMDYYELDQDFGDRFKSLRILPGRYDHGWPRYLYRYSPGKAARRTLGGSVREPSNTSSVELGMVEPKLGMP